MLGGWTMGLPNAVRPLALLLVLVAVLAACSVPRGVLTRRQTAAPGSIDAFVPEAERFVEAHRGLKFKSPVRVQHLADRAFSDRVVQLQRRDHADLDRQAKILRAVGLLAEASLHRRCRSRSHSSGPIS